MRLMVLKSGPLDLKGLCHRPRGTAGNSWRVYVARSNPDPISEKKMSFSTPVFRPGL